MIREAISFPQSDYVHGVGLHLARPKCKIWWPTEPVAADREGYPNMIRKSYGSGTDVLKYPIGSDTLVCRAIIYHAKNAQDLLYLIFNIEDAHVAIYLLRSCAGT